MFTLVLLIVVLFPLTLRVPALTNLFSPDELDEMGVCLDNSHD